MMLTRSMRVPLFLAACRNVVPLPSGPFCSTGMVTETTRPALFASRVLIAWNRRLYEVGSAMAAPSMSKSRWLTWYLLITLWYADVSDAVFVQDWASSTPAAPPNEMIVCAPSLCARAIFALAPELLMSSVSPQIGVQPLPLMNAAVYALSPACVIALSSIPELLADRST